MSTPVIEVKDLVVEYGKGKKAQRAVNGLSFHVGEGECVGFIGANGAGKSTTIKALMGFLFPAAGTIRVHGEPAGTTRSRQRIGYLPEVALYYPFMKARELLELYGGLSGLKKAELRAKIPGLLERVGLGGKGEKLLRTFSKGMQQRLGIAQALIAEPDLLILDELDAGLDPIGRHDLREVLLDLKRKGTTLFFSSHELTEVEALCDRVIVIHRGRLLTEAPVSSLMQPLNQFEITFAGVNGATLPESIARLKPHELGDHFQLMTQQVEDYLAALTQLIEGGFQIQRTSSRTRSLEDHFIDLVGQGEGTA